MSCVLLVEDNVNISDNISLELQMNGYTVNQAVNGQQALDMLSTMPTLPDIIVSDINMPSINGYELLANCQRNPNWSSIPFIFLTALADRKDILTGKKLGADDYLVKPFRGDELIVAIENKLKRVEQLKVDAERKLDSTRRELLTIIAHELRTPLSAIYGGAELLADSLADIPDSMSKRMLNLVQSGAKRMRRLVDQIVFLTQVDTGSLAQSLQNNPRSYDMKLMLERAYKLIEEEYLPDPIPVTCNFYLPDAPVMVTGNPDFLAMMVGEGIRNAIAFSPGEGQVEVELAQDDQFAYVTVTDHGKGIEADDLDRIFNRFIQIDRDKHEQQGTGLGLALVRESARLHRGDCIVESAVGLGTRFILKLPLSNG